MRTALLFRFLFFALFGLGGMQSATATHVLGGDISYTYIPGSASRYHITARLYARDPAACGNCPDQVQAHLVFLRNGCSPTQSGSLFLTITRNQTTPRTLGCPGSIAAYLVNTYETDVTLLPGQWTISVVSENRAAGIRNLVNSGSSGSQISAFLDNSSGLTNSSPRFTSFTLPYVCSAQPYRYSFSTFEADGDSLVYESVQPVAGLIGSPDCGTPIAYAGYPAGQFQDPVNGQTASYLAGQFTTGFPLPSFRALNGVAVPQFDLNTANGDLLTTPIMQVGYYTVAVRVNEYRRLNGSWTKIGSVTRDVIYLLLNGAGNRNPSFTGLTVAGASTSQPTDQAIAVAPGQTVSLTLTATDPDAGQTLQLSSDVATAVPGASFQTQGSNQGVLTWQVPATLPPGRYSLTVTAADNSCPIIGSEVRTINFVVSGRPLSTRASSTKELTAYPVPFHDQVQFKLPVTAVQTVVITDNLGRLVDTITSRPDGSVQWQPTASVAPGIYFARPTGGGYVCRLLRQ
ncbi:T9SS type A sorting domain-containing protein [Hymenobacter norwichensis]|uniref:T9SS type A sorting domain-containing protein n=1 Tax=Hymenobacter norwichensis TaxID=223903 RepID=UPI0003B4FD69|nr:T9SS type A sorting domain-containing protein [Hymenobacter norwichensis]